MIIPAPAIAPEEAFVRCLRGERPFFLDGSGDADGLGRYSLVGCDPEDGITWRSGDAGDPAALLAEAQRRWSTGPADEAPWPTAVGYLGYDLGEALVARPAGRRLSAVDDLGLPQLDFARYRAVWRWDAVTRRAVVISDDARAAERLLTRLQRAPLPLPRPACGPARWELGDDEYRRRFARVREYLLAGDAYQVNLAHRVLARCDDAAALPAVFLALRRRAPAPLGAFLQTRDTTLLSNTPELLLRVARRVRDGRAGWQLETRPIKGTRPRAASPEEDARLGAELEASAKDAAEHLMIVDLLRNDLGRVAEVGSVVVDGFARRVALPTVHHLISTVSAFAPDRLTLAQLLPAVFPGGSVTGAPKLRAMEIIDELEGVRRGPYCGAIGWLGPGLRLDLALAIRTAVARAGELVWSVGGGIVADSDADTELAETRWKARAFLDALAG